MYLIQSTLKHLFENDHQDDDEDPSIPHEHLDQSNLSAIIRNPIIEQAPIAIREFSSQYGSNRSDSYVISNICSKVEIYPAYGDSTQSSVFRTYGPWWIILPSYQHSIAHFTRSEYHFQSQDFIDIEFQTLVHQCLHLNIYETYNPGTLQVVYVGEEDEQGQIHWHRIWTYPEPFSIILANDQEIYIENGSNE